MTSHNVERDMENGQAGLPGSPSTTTTLRIEANEQKLDLKNEKQTFRTESTLTESGSGEDVPSVWQRFRTSLGIRFQGFQRKPARPSKIAQINEYPKGYPNLAAFLDSHECFMMYRRFGHLQSRLLLQKQDELRVLENRLKEMDKKVAENSPHHLESRGWDTKPKKALMGEIEESFCKYSNLLQAAQSMMAFNRPARSDWRSVGNYIDNREPLQEGEDEWILHEEDIVTLRSTREHAWLDDLIEGFLRIFHCSLIERLFISAETKQKAADILDIAGNKHEYPRGYEVFYTPRRIANLSNGILLCVILLVLIVPISIMYRLISSTGTEQAYGKCIAVMFVFTLAFSAVVRAFTKAKRHELLAAAAGYCAVLVVFLSNVGDK